MEKILLEKAKGSFVEACGLMRDFDNRRLQLSVQEAVLLFQIVRNWIARLNQMLDNETCSEMKRDYRDFSHFLNIYSYHFYEYFAENRESFEHYLYYQNEEELSADEKNAIDLFVLEVAKVA